MISRLSENVSLVVRSRLSEISTWPRPIFSFSRRRSCISRPSVPEGRRKCRSRNRWLTDFSDREGHVAVGLSRTGGGLIGAIRALDFTSHLRKTCHRAYGHRGRVFKVQLLLWENRLGANQLWTNHLYANRCRRIVARRDAGTYLTWSSTLRGGRCRQWCHFR